MNVRSRAARSSVRVVSAIALAAAATLALTGCGMLDRSLQATLNHYDPTDGVQANLGSVLLRNVIAVTNEDGSVASITFAAINQGEATQLNYSVPTADGALVENWIPIPPGITIVGKGEPQLIVVDGPDAALGGLIALTFQAGDAPSTRVLAPVLNSEGRPYLDPLVPVAAD